MGLRRSPVVSRLTRRRTSATVTAKASADIKALVRWGGRYGIAYGLLRVGALAGDNFSRLCLDASLRASPYDFYDYLRAQGDLVPGRFAAISAKHGIVSDLVRDERLQSGFPDETLPRHARNLLAWAHDPAVISAVDRPSMVVTNGDAHAQFRRLISRAFTERAISTLADRVEHIADELLDAMSSATDQGPVDLIAEYAQPLPTLVIAELLGVPAAMRKQFAQWTTPIVALTDIGIGYSAFKRAERAARALNSWFLHHFRELRRNPGDDLLSRILLHAEAERASGSEFFDDTSILANANLLLAAGLETTVNLIGNGIMQLVRHQDQLAILQTTCDWRNAVDEILRFDTPVQLTMRYADRDTDVAGVTLHRGQFVIMLLGAANRDPAVFPEPATFDVSRPNARQHLAFSLGPHYCLGGALARMEGEVALRKLFERFPHLAPTGPPRRRPTRAIHGVMNLPATLRPPLPRNTTR